jgi:hypothetical protein
MEHLIINKQVCGNFSNKRKLNSLQKLEDGRLWICFLLLSVSLNTVIVPFSIQNTEDQAATNRYLS